MSGSLYADTGDKAEPDVVAEAGQQQLSPDQKSVNLFNKGPSETDGEYVAELLDHGPAEINNFLHRHPGIDPGSVNQLRSAAQKIQRTKEKSGHALDDTQIAGVEFTGRSVLALMNQVINMLSEQKSAKAMPRSSRHTDVLKTAATKPAINIINRIKGLLASKGVSAPYKTPKAIAMARQLLNDARVTHRGDPQITGWIDNYMKHSLQLTSSAQPPQRRGRGARGRPQQRPKQTAALTKAQQVLAAQRQRLSQKKQQKQKQKMPAKRSTLPQMFWQKPQAVFRAPYKQRYNPDAISASERNFTNVMDTLLSFSPPPKMNDIHGSLRKLAEDKHLTPEHMEHLAEAYRSVIPSADQRYVKLLEEKARQKKLNAKRSEQIANGLLHVYKILHSRSMNNDQAEDMYREARQVLS